MTELIAFHGMEIEATCENGMPYANLRRLCECLGLDFAGQFTKLREAHWACIANIPTHDNSGRIQPMAFISADTIPMWLATINVKKVAESVQPQLRVLQSEIKEALYRHFGGDRGAISVNAASLREMSLSVTELKEQVATIFSKLAETNERLTKVFEELVPMVRRIDERTASARENIKPQDKKRIERCVWERFNGMCPCCQTVRVMQDGKRIAYAAEFEHFVARSMASIEHVWLTCKRCNTKLKNRKPQGYWFVKVPAFQHFQTVLVEMDSKQLCLSFLGAT